MKTHAKRPRKAPKQVSQFQEYKEFVAWAQGRGAKAIKIGDIEVIFPAREERSIGFQMPVDPHGWGEYE
jgi:hypothetical protein